MVMHTHAEATCFSPTSDAGIVDAVVATAVSNSSGFAQIEREPVKENAGAIVISKLSTGDQCRRQIIVAGAFRGTSPGRETLSPRACACALVGTLQHMLSLCNR